MRLRSMVVAVVVLTACGKKPPEAVPTPTGGTTTPATGTPGGTTGGTTTGGVTTPQYDVLVHSYDSHPFFKELGIKPEVEDVGRGMWVDFDFTMDLGVELWKADTSG